MLAVIPNCYLVYTQDESYLSEGSGVIYRVMVGSSDDGRKMAARTGATRKAKEVLRIRNCRIGDQIIGILPNSWSRIIFERIL